jgi:hypothetical protein
MAEKKQTKKEAEKAFHVELIERMVTLSTSGFGLVAALAWNNVVQEFINSYVKKYLPTGSGLLSLFLYALIITALAVFITYELSKIQKRIEQEK